MTKKGEIRRKWPADKEARLRQLWPGSLTLSEIAADLSSPGFEVTRGSVHNKGSLMGLGLRPGSRPTKPRKVRSTPPDAVPAALPAYVPRKRFPPPPGAQYVKHTRRESEEILRQAILNTGGRLVEND